jgi:hypothetical protein
MCTPTLFLRINKPTTQKLHVEYIESTTHHHCRMQKTYAIIMEEEYSPNEFLLGNQLRLHGKKLSSDRHCQ